MMELQRIENSAIYCKPGSNPTRVVVGKVGNRYCIYLEVLPPNEEPYLIIKQYHNTFDEALIDYQRRIEWLIGKPREGVANGKY